MTGSPRHDPLTRIGALAEPTRRALYDFVVGQSGPVSRDSAAAAVDVPRHSAKFHLDRLVEEGLLEVEFRRLSGRTGPGAGRPSKLYRRSVAEVSVSLPPREYDLAGAILAAAVERSTASGETIDDAVDACARESGTRIGQAVVAPGGGLRRLAAALAPHGYEPQVNDRAMVLANCPFHRLAQEHRDLVCGLNLQLVEGAIEGAACAGLHARLDPDPSRCCVVAQALD